jgi:IPT/TIG domain
MGSIRRTLWVPVFLASVTIVSLSTGTLAAGGAVPGRAPATGYPPAVLTVSVAPSPQIEVGTGVGPIAEVAAVVTVSGPSSAGKKVKVDAPQLEAACSGSFSFETLEGGSVASPVTGTSLSVALDGAGNADLIVKGSTCEPGTYAVDAKLVSDPGTKGSADLDVDQPATSPSGLTLSPNPEVETSDEDVYGIFSVEMPATSADETVEVTSPELDAACSGWRYEPSGGGTVVVNGDTAEAPLDNDANAVFVFEGTECAPGSSLVIAALIEGPYYTYETLWNTTSEAPTITSFTPGKGEPGDAVVISGTNLLASPPPTVTFGGVAATVTTDSTTEIRTAVPAGAVTGPIEVTTSGGSATSTKKFKVK